MFFIKPKPVDKNGRLVLGKPLLEIAGFTSTTSEKVAICDGINCILLRKMDDVLDCDIIAITTLDHKGRIYIPKDILENFSMFMVKVRNGKLIIECFA